jgi:hypothetical protein
MSFLDTEPVMASDGFSFDLFLSHNSGDKDRVRALAQELRTAGLRVWFDEWIIKPGDDIYLAAERSMEASRVLVLCLSPAAFGGRVETSCILILAVSLRRVAQRLST